MTNGWSTDPALCDTERRAVIVNLATRRLRDEESLQYISLDCCMMIESLSVVSNICVNAAGEGSDHCKHSL